MYIPDIPGISTSVIDQSVIQKKINNNRTILLPGFFKYGKEGFTEYTDYDEFKDSVGPMDLYKYGNAYLFGELASRENKVLCYRLLPDDATYANNVIDYNGSYTTKTNVTRKDQIFITMDDNGQILENTSLLSALAMERGEGYNDIFMTFKPATDFEKAYANSNGELQYKFNFIQAEVFEETPVGVKAVSDPIIFSLMEVDELTGQPIVDKETGKSLYVNHVFKDTNNFATLMINDDKYGPDIKRYQNIDSLINAKRLLANDPNSTSPYVGLNGRFVVKDINDERYYEIFVETYYEMVPNNLGIYVRTKKNRLACKITTRLPAAGFYPFLRYYNSTDAEADTKHFVQIVVDDNILSYDFNALGTVSALEDSGVLDSDNIAMDYFVDGSDALYTMRVIEEQDPVDGTTSYTVGYNEYVGSNVTVIPEYTDPETGVVTPEHTVTNIDFLRYQLYQKMITYSMKLYSGSDGVNLYDAAGRLNMYDHAGDIFSQNARELLLDFYNTNQEIREVLYPKYDFDYIPDWTDDSRIQSAIILLADDIGCSMPIIGTPLLYNPKIITTGLVDRDLTMRKEGVFWSSYNSMMYSGQVNKSHVLNSGQRIYLGTAYYALQAHLRTDAISITEPAANMIKGAIDTEILNLTYSPSSIEIEQLRNVQINAIIEEPDGTYFIDQLTMYKKASKLSRGNVVKVIHRIRKDLPRLLKDLIQVKSNNDISGTATDRVNKYMEKWKVSNTNANDGIFQSVSVKSVYNESLYKLRITVTVNPIGTIETIEIPVIVI